MAFNDANIESGHSETVLKGVRHDSLFTIKAVVRPGCRRPRWARCSVVMFTANVDDISEARGNTVLPDRLTDVNASVTVLPVFFHEIQKMAGFSRHFFNPGCDQFCFSSFSIARKSNMAMSTVLPGRTQSLSQSHSGWPRKTRTRINSIKMTERPIIRPITDMFFFIGTPFGIILLHRQAEDNTLPVLSPGFLIE